MLIQERMHSFFTNTPVKTEKNKEEEQGILEQIANNPLAQAVGATAMFVFGSLAMGYTLEYMFPSKLPDGLLSDDLPYLPKIDIIKKNLLGFGISSEDLAHLSSEQLEALHELLQGSKSQKMLNIFTEAIVCSTEQSEKLNSTKELLKKIYHSLDENQDEINLFLKSETKLLEALSTNLHDCLKETYRSSDCHLKVNSIPLNTWANKENWELLGRINKFNKNISICDSLAEIEKNIPDLLKYISVDPEGISSSTLIDFLYELSLTEKRANKIREYMDYWKEATKIAIDAANGLMGK